jgi:2-isopropylmalate synthase
MAAFTAHYLDHTAPYELVAYTHSSEEDSDQIAARVRVYGEERVIDGEGNGPLAAWVDAFATAFGVAISIRDYHEHAMSASADATAAAYVEADVDDESFWGVGLHGSILTASLRAIVNAANRAASAREARV